MKEGALTSTLTVKVTKAEREALRRAADLAGVSVSSLARNLMRKGSLDKLVSSFFVEDAQPDIDMRVQR